MDNKSTEKSPYWESFRTSLKRILKEKGTKQKSLAEAIGVKPGAISAWLAESSGGKSPPKFPNAEHLFKMADVLQVSLDRLVGRRVLGTDILEQAREQSRQQADALDQILPAQGDHERGFSSDKTSHSRAKRKPKGGPKRKGKTKTSKKGE